MSDSTNDPTTTTAVAATNRLSTGVSGLDEVLDGGLIPCRSYMLRGNPGSGKTILGLHFLIAGTANDESVLYIALEETAADIRANARSVGFDLSGIEFLDLTPESDAFAEDGAYDVFDPSEVEQDALVDGVIERVEAVDPDRVFIDPITQFRFLAPDQYQFRKQILSLTRFFGERGTTILFATQTSRNTPDDDLQFMADGVIELGTTTSGRTLTVPKFRGSDTKSGTHALRVTDTGMKVFPELYPRQGEAIEYEQTPISSGVPELDEHLHGGFERGTITVVSGPTGVGKTTLGTQFVKEAAGRGTRSAIYLFEESARTFLNRSEAINIPVAEMREQETLTVEEIEALQLSAQEFAHHVRQDVEEENTEIVMIDGIPGYKQSIQGDDNELTRRLHQLTRYLKRQGVTVILTEEIASVTGEFRATDSGVSYLADNIVFLRYIEMQGRLRKVIGVLKKRASDFERTLREFQITEHGLKVGEPLPRLRNILTGVPDWTDTEMEIESHDESR